MKKALPIFCGILAVIALFVFRQTIFYNTEKTTNEYVQKWLEEKEKKTVYCNASVTYRTPNDSSVTYYIYKRGHGLDYFVYNNISGPYDVDSIVNIYTNKDTFVLCDDCFADSSKSELAAWIREAGKEPNVELRKLKE